MKKSSLLFTLLTLIQVATAGAQTVKPGISGGQNSGGGRCAAAQEQTQSSDGSQSSSQSNCKPGQTQAQGRDKDGSTWQTQSQMQDVALGQPGVDSQEEEIDTAKDVSHIYSFAAYAIEKFYKKDISALVSSGGLFEGVTITGVESASPDDDDRIYKVSYVGMGSSTSVQSVFVEISSISREQQERQTQAAFPDAANNHMTWMAMTWSGYQPQTLKLRVMGSRR